VATSLKLLYFKEVATMENHPGSVKNALSSVICGMEKASMLYAKNPEMDFTRN